MRKLITRKNLDIRKTMTGFWQQAALVCCMIVLFLSLGNTQKAFCQDDPLSGIIDVSSFTGLSLQAPSCITNSASVNDVFACTGTSGELAFSMLGLQFPNPGAPTAYQWQISTLPNVWNNVTNGGVNGYLNASGTTPDVNFGRNLFIGDDTGLNGTMYRAIITYPAGYCTTSLTTNALTLFIFDPPTVNVVSSPDPICSGTSGTLTAMASGPVGTTLVYDWSTGETTQQISIPNVTDITPEYSVTVTEHILYKDKVETGCFAAASGSFNVIQPPSVSCSVYPGNTVCEGEDVTFTANATGEPVLYYQWQYNNVNISGATNATLSINDVTTSAQGTYKVIVTNQCGNASCSEDLIINNAPQITSFVIPEGCIPSTNAAPKTFTFTVTATGTLPLNFQWQFNNVDIAGATNTAYSITTNNPFDAGSYSVIVTNACGKASESGVLSVCPCTPPTIISQPSNLEICEGKTGEFLVIATGTQPLMYQWYNGEGAIEGATDNTFTTGAAGTYFVVVSNDPTNCGESITSETVTLTLDFAPQITDFNSPEGCIPSKNIDPRTFEFSVTASGTEPLSYQWQHNNVDIVGATDDSFTLTTNDANDQGTYTVVVTNACGTASATATILPCACTPPDIQLIPDQEICQGQTANFSVIATGTQPLMYQWFNGDGAIAGATNNTYSTGVAGSYFVVVTNDPTNCGESLTSNTAVLTVNPNLDVTCMPSVTKGNPGESTVFSVTVNAGVNVTYQWSFDGNILADETNSTYTRTLLASDNGKQVCVVVSASCGEPFTCCTTLDVCTTPSVSCPQSGSVCLGGSITFTATGEGAGPFSYQWYKSCCQKESTTCTPCEQYKKWNYCNQCKTRNVYDKSCDNFDLGKCYNDWHNLWGGCDNNTCSSCPKQIVCSTVAIEGATESSLTLNNVQYSDTCRYFVVLTGPCGTATSCNATITINKPPVIKSQPTCSAKCVNDCVTLTVNANGTGTLTYQWLKDNVTIAGATNSSYTICPIALTDAGKYNVVVSNDCGSVTSNVTVLKVNTPPVLTCQPKDVKVCGSCSINTNNYFGSWSNSSKACFTICTSGNVKIQWLENGKPINYCLAYSGTNSSTLCVNDLKGKNGFVYSAVISNSCGSITSDKAVLTVVNPPVITKQPIGICVADGSSASFSVTATGDDLTYQWQMNGVNLSDGSIFSGTSTNTLNISDVTGLNGKCFTVVVKNSCSSVTSCKVTLQVKTVCSTPANLNSCEPTSFTEKITWGVVSGANGYQIALFCGNSTYPTYINVSNCSSYTFCNLKPSTKYCWKIRTICGNCGCSADFGYNQNTYSEWSDLTCFTTPACQSKRLTNNAVNTSDNEMTVYPNPSFGLINVNLPAVSENTVISVYNMSGQAVYTEKVPSTDNASNKQIDLSSYGSGIYFVRLSDSLGVKTVKLIIQ